jgi:hypothetical protein
MTQSTAAPPSRKKSVLLSVGFLLFLAAVAWFFDGWLLVRLRMIAAETFSAERASNPMLSVDAVHELLAYPPKRLARFLSTPADQIRSVICLSLEGRRGVNDPDQWTGVLPALLSLAKETEDDELRRRALMAAWHVNVIPDADVETAFQFADERIAAPNDQWPLASKLLETVAGSHPDLVPRVLQTLERSLVLGTKLDLNETLRRLARVAPGSKEAAAAVLAILALPFPNMDRELEIRRLEEILTNQPALLDELARGSLNQRLAAYAFVLKYRNPEAPAALPRSTPARATWPQDRIALMERTAADFLDSSVPNELDPEDAFRLLAGSSDGPERLFEAAKMMKGRRRASAVSSALAAARSRKPPLGERFFVERLPTMTAWTNEDDRFIQHAVLTFSGPWPGDLHWLKSQRTGPDSPIVGAARGLLERHPSRFDYLAMAVFADAGPLAERDVETVVAALDRLMEDFETNFEWSSVKPQGSLTEAHAKLFDLLNDHSTRPSVRKLFERRRNLEVEGILR